MGNDRVRVAIVGGGIGGLAAANALARRDVEVTVYEQAAELGEVGAGVLITPNSVRQLDRMGLGDVMTRLGGRIGDGSRYCRPDGATVGPIRTSDTAGVHGVYGMHRADLLGALAEGLPSGVVRTGHRCTGFEQNEDGALLRFGDGETAEADVVVAADGIHSVLQSHVVDPAAPVYSGHVAYRGLIASRLVPEWPRDAHLVWMGQQQHFMVYPVRGGELLNYVGFLPSAEVAEETWSGKGDPDALRAAFAGWDPLVERLLARVETTYWWGLYDREPLTAWTNGRLTLLGDAAHPMLPHLGQGANQAIEDGVALAVLLAGKSRRDVRGALRSYEEFRRPRTAKVQEGARANGRRYDSQYEDLRQRDAEIASSGELRAWLYDHDVELRAGEFASA
ncbi:salicylate hydroxylase [Prauserella marina]|uniref:Salicylate hydroxylase n=1 Tax=Prauserella marina TaxID=530584 RepID=A0A1G6W3M7_9PSEU|nr:FAD-dependent monooxygenase [Prauserella marina]PWV73951.1 salicylate hydroxylase [Prauserella marina]SDD59636.1 salicylate hydroxylase [Prauserella marina]